MYRPKELLIEEAVGDSPLVRRLLAALPGTPVTWSEKVGPHSAARDREVLEVVKFRGRFVKPCPGTRHYLCCGYQILHLAVQCLLGCTYCVLQSYFPSPNLRLFANVEDMWRQLQAHLRHSPRRVHRLGTGEFTDSLLLDPLTHWSEELVPFFAGQDNAVLELKTKTANVELLENLEHRGHTIVAWSLNPSPLVQSEEAGAPTLAQRLEAARCCQQWGYRLAFHFDPLIAYPDWRWGYADLVARLFSTVDTRAVAWISLGTLRFPPSLASIIRRRHPRSRILDEEFVPGLDGKLRYFRDLRVEMYRHLLELLHETDPGLCVYFCMESEDVWQEVCGFSPAERGGLSAMLDRQALP